MTVYISGAISGKPDRNRAAFDEAVQRVKESCADADYLRVVNPVLLGEKLELDFIEMGRTDKPTENEYLRKDMKELLSCNAMFMIDGWQGSKGANKELKLASMVGIPVFTDYEVLREFCAGQNVKAEDIE